METRKKTLIETNLARTYVRIVPCPGCKAETDTDDVLYDLESGPPDGRWCKQCNRRFSRRQWLSGARILS